MNDNKILFLTSIPSPYQIDFFESLQDLMPDSFSVVFSAGQEIDRQWYKVPETFEFDATILNYKIRRFGKDFHHNPRLFNVLKEKNPSTVIISGSYLMPDARTARRYAIRSKKKYLFWGENPHKKKDWKEGQVTGIQARFKEGYLKWFLKSANGGIGVGKIAELTYRRLAGEVPSENIPYAPNLQAISEPTPLLTERVEELRDGRRKNDDVNILFAGGLIPLKDPVTLIRSFFLVSRNYPNCRLLLAGDGPLRSDLEKLVADLGICNRVEFLGFLEGDELRATYLAADIFVLPTATYEGWGVVVQEAMAASLAVVASSRVGAAVDLFGKDEAGLLFTSGAIEELEKILERLINCEDLRTRLGENAREIVLETGATSAALKFKNFANKIGM